ncbi:GNAT family N-acetyltransferase [Haloplasma contractile]|uniref:Phospholipiddiacylglycerol acyltransferase protein n=1 Tax=Haloplasma contractile SSD-17B TaxID=1033810 RepID=F7PWY5_9MOLU|nr:GNAT family N-acetyltransferase [Haloplasma contractile]ERJ12776.1 phospholipiddiacylglycerol acyltransferase protein [Haloplasma contractile SSD-17B]
MNNLNIRKMKDQDVAFIIDLSTRFNEFEMMNWRDHEKMKQAQLEMAKEAVAKSDSDSDMYVVEDESKTPLGYLHMTKQIDYFTDEHKGYISSIVVSKAGEGKGIGKKLMKKAEQWSKEKGYKQLVLNVFSKNERAVEFYKKLDYESEIIKMVKELE